jgi:hypothetical protein
MKKAILLCLTILCISCSNENEATPDNEPFFNLEIGNVWVYQRFNSADNINFIATNRIDSVRIVGDTTIAGINYTIRRHQIQNDNQISDEYLREDENGHLVFASGIVLNPGIDMNYVHVRNFYDMGNITYQLQEPTDVTVEGEVYHVYPYVGLYVPFDSSLPSQTIYDQYQRGLGLVCQRCTTPSGTSSYEERLIYTNID